MSFTNTKVTRSLVLGIVSASVGASLLDVKHYFYILVDPHLLRYHQTWRILTYQLCYTNSSEVLFACMTLYQLRIVERMWGSRKFASFLAVSTLLTTVLPPLLVSVLRPLTWGYVNYLPAGPTALVFAILAQYYAIVPRLYTYRVALSASGPPASSSSSLNNDSALQQDGDGRPGATSGFVGLTLSDKSYRYFLALQLALMQWPGSLISAAVGWAVGHVWRNGMLPDRLQRWRIPGWMVGERSHRRRNEFDGLRRRLEGENGAAATASGVDPGNTPLQAGRRRPATQPVQR